MATIQIGSEPSRAHEAALRRVLLGALAGLRASLPEIAERGLASAAQRKMALNAVRVSLSRTLSNAAIEAALQRVGTQAEAAGSRPWRRFDRADVLDRRRARKRPPYNGARLLASWIGESTGMITSVRSEIVGGLSADLLRALEAGTTAEDLAARWLRQGIPVEWGTAEGRLKTIARSQLSQLRARVQQARSEAVGVTRFTWRTQGDSRVRPEHRALAGQVFEWSKGAPGHVLPGHPINCRCWAESVVDDELLAELGIRGVVGTVPRAA